MGITMSTFKRWLWTAVLYAIVTLGLWFVMESMYESIGISPSSYSDLAWWIALQNMLFNTVAASLALLLLWNALFSYALLGKGRKGVDVCIWTLVFVALHIAAGIATLFYAVTPILQNASDVSLAMFMRVLIQWNVYGTDFLMIHLLPSLMILPFLAGILLFGPECIAHKFFPNNLRRKLGIY